MRSLKSGLPLQTSAVTLFFALLLAVGAPTGAQYPPIGIIDFYGLRYLSEMDVRAALRITEGDAVPEPPARAEATARVQALPGVASARLQFVCCDDNKAILYVGIEERGAPTVRFLAAPAGSARLSDDVRHAGAAFETAAEAAVRGGDMAEDESHGHSLMHDPAARAVQEGFITYAARDVELLRTVLRTGRDADERALAAQVLGYAADKRRVVPDLARAVRDPAEDVRNNAMRALWIVVPFEPFIDLLQSPAWTDRNKASLALMEISGARNKNLLVKLRTRAMPALVEMARWKSQGHAYAAFAMLGRIAGWPEDAIDSAWERGDRESVIRAVR